MGEGRGHSQDEKRKERPKQLEASCCGLGGTESTGNKKRERARPICRGSVASSAMMYSHRLMKLFRGV